MTDIVDKKTRSRMMSGIRGKDTKPETIVRRWLHRRGFRFRLHNNSIPGHPDLWLKKYNAAIFVHGCFWHRHEGCRYAYNPKSRVDFWQQKFTNNQIRDESVAEQLAYRGVRRLVIWECVLTKIKDPDPYLRQVEEWLLSDAMVGEVPAEPVAGPR